MKLNNLQNDDDQRFRDIVSSRMEGAVVRFTGIWVERIVV
jgi:hypothetical protein